MADRNIDGHMAVRAFNIVGHFHGFRHGCVFYDFIKRRFVDLDFHSQFITSLPASILPREVQTHKEAPMTERTYTIKTELSGGAPIHGAVLTEDGINAIAPLLVQLFAAALAAGHEND